MEPDSVNLAGKNSDLNEYICIMNDAMIKELFRENLCTYFILPLLKLNKFRFSAESNFIDSYISEDRTCILVEVLEILFFEHRFESHPQFSCIYDGPNGTHYLEFKIPSKYMADVDMFCEGKYSQMSKAAQDLIGEYSGLICNQMSDAGEPITDVRLLALQKSPVVKEMWETWLTVSRGKEPDLENQELLSIPPVRSFINTDQLTRVK